MKHAYLIIAHNQFELLKMLVKMLDNKNNDIYILIDKKAKEFNKQEFDNLLTYASITFVKRISVIWASSSQIEAELILLEQATKQYHDYYHLLSGVDLPIKSQCQIDEFFEDDKGKEFVSFDDVACETNNFLGRVAYYNFSKLGNKTICSLNNLMVKIQKLFHINRIRKSNVKFKKGSNWFDITHEFAKYVVDQMRNNPIWRKMFKFTSFCDEIFIQTLLYSSSFYENLSNKSVRYIDWSQHNNSPETLTEKDFDKLLLSDCLYARKFSLSSDDKLVKKVFDEFSD